MLIFDEETKQTLSDNTIESMTLNSFNNEFDVMIKSLKNNHSLENLTLSRIEISDDQLDILIETLLHHPSIKSFRLTNHKEALRRKQMGLISKLATKGSNINELDLTNTTVSNILDALITKQSYIKTLRLKNCKLTTKDIEILCKNSKNFQDITCLELSDNKFNQKNLEQLINFVKSHQNLYELYLEKAFNKREIEKSVIDAFKTTTKESNIHELAVYDCGLNSLELIFFQNMRKKPQPTKQTDCKAHFDNLGFQENLSQIVLRASSPVEPTDNSFDQPQAAIAPSQRG